MSRPEHHLPGGRFRNPWPEAAGDDALRRDFWRLAFQAATRRREPNPPPGSFPVETPSLVTPRLPVDAHEVRVTWLGHATTLIQLPGLNLLTDPVWSDRCSPVGFAGPRRFVPPPLALDRLPPVDAVLLSHDHYDHLDRPTVEGLHRRFGDDVTWFTPLGYRDWFSDLGVTRVVERDWWEEASLPGGAFQAVAVPARHWTRRRPRGTNRRLWCGWVVRPSPAAGSPGDLKGPVGGPRGPRLYFAGDSGYCPAFAQVGERLGPFHVSLVPVGAYEPRWFMGAAHMNPEEAVRAYLDAGGKGAMVPIHWGTWRLTFEDPLEPPVRARAAWTGTGLPPGDLAFLRHGETLVRAIGG